MPHIHTEPGQIDFVADVFVVHRNRVLLRLHDKYNKWLTPGGHIELDEIPEEAAVREVKEEVGLDVKIWKGTQGKSSGSIGFEDYRELTLPSFLNIHRINDEHRHLSFVYFATSDTDKTTQPDNHEKTECRWLTKEEILAADYIEEVIKMYALKALEVLST